MTLSVAEHRAVAQATRRQRNERARQRREVRLLDVLTPDGEVLTVATSATEPGRAYLLVREPGGWACGCVGYAFRRHCSHILAAREREARRLTPDAPRGP